jgi:acyl-CoA reductase-like NAD-dependent aldehyde dehydrogenase
VAADFRDALLAHTAKLRVGDPRAEETDLGPVIHEQHLAKVLGYIDAGRAAGAGVICGGERLADGEFALGAFIAPTVLDLVSGSSPVFHEEIFGPVVSLTTFTDSTEAVRLANATKYGLANTLWSTDMSTALGAARGLRSGTVWINTHLDGATTIPFGGVKASGFGREAGREGLLEFADLKTVQIRTAARAYGFGAR